MLISHVTRPCGKSGFALVQVLQHNPKPAPGVVVCLSDGSRGVPFSAISLTEDGSFEQHLDKQDTGNSFIWFVYTGKRLMSDDTILRNFASLVFLVNI